MSSVAASSAINHPHQANLEPKPNDPAQYPQYIWGTLLPHLVTSQSKMSPKEYQGAVVRIQAAYTEANGLVLRNPGQIPGDIQVKLESILTNALGVVQVALIAPKGSEQEKVEKEADVDAKKDQKVVDVCAPQIAPIEKAAANHHSQPSGKQTTYLDFNQIISTVWTFSGWVQNPKPPYDGKMVFDSVGFSQYLQSIFHQIKQAGSAEIDLSFAQFGMIDELAKGNLNAVWPGVQPPDIEIKEGNLLKILIDQAHLANLKVNLAFGGEHGADYTICKEGKTAIGQAQKLSDFMKQMGLDGLDFDIENGGFSENVADALAFFTALHNQLSAQGKTVTLTILGAVRNAQPGGSLSMLFTAPDGRSIFHEMFDGLNLMMYNAMTQYYIDADDETWGIKQWIDLLGKDKADTIHIGFDDAIPYASKEAHASSREAVPYPYDIDTDDNGKAAAQIFQQLQEQLIKLGVPKALGSPFWWPDEGSRPGTRERYVPRKNPDGTWGCKFATNEEMQSFYDQLHADKASASAGAKAS